MNEEKETSGKELQATTQRPPVPGTFDEFEQWFEVFFQRGWMQPFFRRGWPEFTREEARALVLASGFGPARTIGDFELFLRAGASHPVSGPGTR